jgi:peptide/nickel transport system substrate-binding protein
MNRRTFLRYAAGAAATGAAAALLSACGGSATAPTTVPTTAPTAAANQPATAAAPAPTAAPTVASASGVARPAGTTSAASAPAAAPNPASAAGQGTAINVTAVDIPNIDPAVGHDGAISTTQKHLYDTLYRHVGNPPQLVPWLAKSYEVTPDAKQWTFTLDERAKFQDGSPVTADAVVYSVQRILKINKGVAFMFKGILSDTGVTAADAKTVKFALDKPFAPFLHSTAWIFVLNPAIVKQHEQNNDMGQGWLTTHSAGSGPFVIKRWEQGNIFEFAADPNYWRGWEGPHVASYVHQVSRESSTKRTALMQGQAQSAEWLSVDDIGLLKKTNGIVVPESPSIAVYTIKLNTSRGPTSDVNVRRAMSYAFDYKAMLDVMAGRAVRITGPLAPTLPGVKKDLAGYETNLDKAKAELAKSAQYKDGFAIDYLYVTGLDEERQTGQILLDQLSKLNIKVNVTAVEWANVVATFADAQKSPAMFPIYSGSDYPDPDNFLWQSFHSSSAGTWTGADWYSNPKVDQLLEQARSTTDQNQRNDLYGQVQQIVSDEAVEIFCFSQVGGLVHRDNLLGYEYCPVMGSSPFWYRMSLKA